MMTRPKLDTAEAVVAYVRKKCTQQSIDWHDDVLATAEYIAKCVQWWQATNAEGHGSVTKALAEMATYDARTRRFYIDEEVAAAAFPGELPSRIAENERLRQAFDVLGVDQYGPLASGNNLHDYLREAIKGGDK